MNLYYYYYYTESSAWLSRDLEPRPAMAGSKNMHTVEIIIDFPETSNICPVRVLNNCEINFGTDTGEYGKF